MVLITLTVHAVLLVGVDQSESYIVDDSGSHCADGISIPTPIFGTFNDYPLLRTYRRGVIACGGYKDGLAAHKKKCQHWFPGDPEWKYKGVDWNHDHIHNLGEHVSLNGEEIMVVSNYPGNSKVEILEGGAWAVKADFPVSLLANGLVALSAHEVVSICGASSHEPPIVYSLVYKYDRVSDEWTQMPKVPHQAGAWPNCALAPGTRFIYCFGARDSTPKVVRLDTDSWSWKNLGSSGLSKKAHWASLMYPHQGKLHMLRGKKGYTLDYTDKLEVFDPATETWEETKDLTFSNFSSKFRVFFSFDVVCPNY